MLTSRVRLLAGFYCQKPMPSLHTGAVESTATDMTAGMHTTQAVQWRHCQ